VETDYGLPVDVSKSAAGRARWPRSAVVGRRSIRPDVGRPERDREQRAAGDRDRAESGRRDQYVRPRLFAAVARGRGARVVVAAAAAAGIDGPR